MNLSVITGIIRRRLLLNYRVAPEVVQKILPDCFQPKVVEGYAIAGICLIRLEKIRPKGVPGFVGIASENSAHRFAVQWESASGPREGVFVPRRDTDSRLNALAGGRVFPGVHHHSRFTTNDEGREVTLRVEAGDTDGALVDLAVSESERLPEDSIFQGLQESSQFFENGSVGYSSRPDSCVLDGLQLKVENWKVSPVDVHHLRSAYFDDCSLFPRDSIEFDHALLMRDISHEWHSEAPMVAK